MIFQPNQKRKQIISINTNYFITYSREFKIRSIVDLSLHFNELHSSTRNSPPPCPPGQSLSVALLFCPLRNRTSPPLKGTENLSLLHITLALCYSVGLAEDSALKNPGDPGLGNLDLYMSVKGECSGHFSYLGLSGACSVRFMNTCWCFNLSVGINFPLLSLSSGLPFWRYKGPPAWHSSSTEGAVSQAAVFSSRGNLLWGVWCDREN